MVVIRPGNNLYNHPYHTRSTTTAEPPSFVSDNEVIQQTDLVAQSSIATGKTDFFKKVLKILSLISFFAFLASWSTSGGWQVTTQPNFITKPKPSQWDKVTQARPKPKPSKKPILSTHYQNTKRPSTPKPQNVRKSLQSNVNELL